MDRAHADALMVALAGQKVPASAVMSFPAGAEQWQVEINPSFALTGAQVAALVNYCAAQGLTVSATFSYLGIV